SVAAEELEVFVEQIQCDGVAEGAGAAKRQADSGLIGGRGGGGVVGCRGWVEEGAGAGGEGVGERVFGAGADGEGGLPVVLLRDVGGLIAFEVDHGGFVARPGDE